MGEPKGRLTIGKFAAAEGVSVETVRFYQRKGLLPLPDRRGSGFREYAEDDQWRLAFIRRARLLGFTLTEIGDLLGPAEAVWSGGRRRGASRSVSTEDITRATEAKLAAVTGQIAELSALACRLRRIARVCAHGSRDDCVALHLPESETASLSSGGTMSMSTAEARTWSKAVTDESFAADVLASPRPVIVEYWAPWCGPCRQVGPVLDAIAAEYAGKVDVVTLNTDENPETMRRYGIMMVPTINLFSGGEVVKQVIGARSKAALLREFAQFI